MLNPSHAFPILIQVTELVNDKKHFSVFQPRASILDPQAEPRMGQSQCKFRASGNQLALGISQVSWNPRGLEILLSHLTLPGDHLRGREVGAPSWRAGLRRNAGRPWVPLGGAQNTQLLAVANGGSEQLRSASQVCGVHFVLSVRRTLEPRACKDPRSPGLVGFVTLPQTSPRAEVLELESEVLARLPGGVGSPSEPRKSPHGHYPSIQSQGAHTETASTGRREQHPKASIWLASRDTPSRAWSPVPKNLPCVPSGAGS